MIRVSGKWISNNLPADAANLTGRRNSHLLVRDSLHKV